jgi:cytochrome c553
MMRYVKRILAVLAIMCVWGTQGLAEVTEAPNPIDISKAVKRCKACHGSDLRGKKKSPTLYGKEFSAVYTSLTSDVPKKMRGVAKKLTDEEAREVSRFISALGPDTGHPEQN